MMARFYWMGTETPGLSLRKSESGDWYSLWKERAFWFDKETGIYLQVHCGEAFVHAEREGKHAGSHRSFNNITASHLPTYQRKSDKDQDEDRQRRCDLLLYHGVKPGDLIRASVECIGSDLQVLVTRALRELVDDLRIRKSSD